MTSDSGFLSCASVTVPVKTPAPAGCGYAFDVCVRKAGTTVDDARRSAAQLRTRIFNVVARISPPMENSLAATCRLKPKPRHARPKESVAPALVFAPHRK